MRTDPLLFPDLFSPLPQFSFSSSFPELDQSGVSPPIGFLPLFPESEEVTSGFHEDGGWGIELGAAASVSAAPPARRVHFQDGIEEPPTLREGIAQRKQQRRLEVQRARHRQLVTAWDRVMSLPLGEAERRVARVLLGAAIGLNHWPKVGALLKWQPFESPGCLERLGGSFDECHAELWQEIESFVVLVVQRRFGGTLWQWDASMQGPWVEAMEAWPGVQSLLTGLFEMTLELDQKRQQEQGVGQGLFSLSEAYLLTLSRELSPLDLSGAMQTWANGAPLIGQTPHPLLAGTVSAWQRAAATSGEFGWAEFFLGVLRGNPEDQGYLFTSQGGSLAASPCEGAAAPSGVARLAALTGLHAVDRAELDRAVAALATQALHRSLTPESAESSFWKGLAAVDANGLLPQAIQALAAEEPRLLARMARLYFPPSDLEHFGLAARLVTGLAEALVQEQVERIQSSPLSEAQRVWLAQGFQTIGAAVGRNPTIFSPLMQFLHREQRALESLGDRGVSWQKAWDWRAELFAIEMARAGSGSDALQQIRDWLRELHTQLCVLWSESGTQAPGTSTQEALRRAEFMLRVEEVGEATAVHSVLHQKQPGDGPLLGTTVSTELGDLPRSELAALHSYVIERLSRISNPHQLRQALSEALPLATTGLSAHSLLFGDEEWVSPSAFGAVESLSQLIQKCLLELVPQRVAASWASLSRGPDQERELHHCVETIRIAQRVFTQGLPQELKLRFDRVMRHPEIAGRVSGAS